MAHVYDYLIDFKELEVAFTASAAKNDDALRRVRSQPASFSSSAAARLTSQTGSSPFSLHRLASKISHPGSWKRIQRSFAPAIEEGRFQLASKYDGKRAKLCTIEGNLIDTMCVDRRNCHETDDVANRGNILMICCEGNSCYYEIGNMTVALAAGYSAFGWNAPGFCCSTGQPEPVQIRNAIDTVMQYALSVLKFAETDIILFAYSIGGYPATWAATKYPKIRGLFLDACFDELLPLVQLHLKGKMNGLTALFLKNQEINLNVGDLLEQFFGPVKIVRRDRDEIVGMEQENGYVNHTNRLLKSLLTSRYPEIVNSDTFQILEEWLNLYDDTQNHLLLYFDVKCPACPALLDDYLRDHCRLSQPDFPILVGKTWNLNVREHVTLYLVNKHLKTLSGDHLTFLPARFLQLPWNPLQL